ncbi:hypothetical protein CAPTEDRAFT_208334 [Capitella teleta]|uniref:Uncharacterized protein n=1 Tax=Capitella teleta TaxID=283909 RepID=R7UU26_CAPTE|nr:hypothetical protein CAPTEDRAFT_208334 [Capitella teleta]|eukprot:ELU09680.1 hypothetical protein CAPTEDRAFT_208334 [Capitella teleta]
MSTTVQYESTTAQVYTAGSANREAAELTTCDGSDCEVADMDLFLIVAIICFVLGAILILLAVFRLIYFFAEPRREKRHFRYILRFVDSKPDDKYTYSSAHDTPALWY